MAKRKAEGGLVYSTEFGDCRKVAGKGEDLSDVDLGDGIVRIQKQTKGRGGKVMTVVTGIPLQGNELKTLAKELKKKCGVGGALKGQVLEIQGDQRLLLQQELGKRGFTVKLAGG